jgi:hypothetical protein
MFPEMLPCYLGVGRITPFNLIEPGHRIAQVRNVEVPICVMMGEVPNRLSSGGNFNNREGGIWKLPHVLPAPFRGIRRRSNQYQHANQYTKKPSVLHGSSLAAPTASMPSVSRERKPRDGTDASPLP